MLSALKHYLVAAKTANMAELAVVLDASPDAIRAMLSHWIRKGRVERVVNCMGACSQSCAGCNPHLLERYAWLD